jgi:ParB-like nuclease domain
MLKKIKIKNIKPNPFRNVERYPIREEKVEALIKSYEATGGVWPVILGREVGSHVEIPFGHHRKVAWERTLNASDEIEVNIMELSDTDMLKMMAHENLEEWGTSAIVEIETVSAVVKAYAEGKIELNGLPEKTKNVYVRYAPSFLPATCAPLSGAHPYTIESIASFLGWLKPSGRPQEKVATALTALQFIEEEILTEDQFTGLTTKEAEELVRQSRARKEERESEAREADKRAREAEERARATENRQAKKLAEDQKKYQEDKALAARKKGKEEASRVGKYLSEGMRGRTIAIKQAQAEADKIVGLQRRERELRGINNAGRQLVLAIDKLFDTDNYAAKTSALIREAAHMDSGVREALIEALESLAERVSRYAAGLNRVQIPQAKVDERLLGNG